VLEQLDLSPALPEERRERVVILPSNGATFFPLAALGPAGKRLLDRFDSIIWLPSLFALRTRQDAHSPRAGTLIVTPGGTGLRDLAIGDTGAGEVRLDGRAATRAAVLARSATADVVCFYTHGHHEGIEGPSVDLADGHLGPMNMQDRWAGMERVELWACETGVSLPSEPLTPPGVDEPFGLDFTFLRMGARSAIGTLWAVQEIVTAAIVRRYRGDVAAGCDPARALAEAQRWWLGEGLPRLLGLLERRPRAEAVATFVESLGGGATAGSVLETLGPARSPDEPMDAAEVQRWRAHLMCPVSWGGFRFVGVPERRPINPWTDEHVRPIDDDVKREAQRLIESEPEDPEEREDLDAWRERELRELAERTPGTPAPDQAIAAARLFRDRVASSHLHNLLAGLAWLHEALAGDAVPAEARRALAIEAAHLWLDVASGEAFHLALEIPRGGAWARARVLIEGLAGDDADLETARARLAYVEACRGRGVDLAEAARRSWRLLGGELGPAEGTPAAIRRAIAACEWFVATPDAVAGSAARVLAHAGELLRGVEREPPGRELLAPAARLLEARDALASRLDPQRVEAALLRGLTPREQARATRRWLRELDERGAPAEAELLELLSQALGQMEGALWGWPSDRMPLVSSSGTAGRAYRELLGGYLAGKARMTNTAAHAIACLQYACDLRLALRHNAMRLAAAKPELGEPLVEALRVPLHHRELLWTALADAIEIVAPGTEPPAPPARDPFTQPARVLRADTASGFDATSWTLGVLCDWRAPDEEEARTAAYQVVRMAAHRTRTLEDTWGRFGEAVAALAEQEGPEAARRFLAYLDPGIILEDNERFLREIPAGRAVLALSLDPKRGLIGACLWRDERGPGQRLVHVEDPALTGLMLQLMLPREGDHTPIQGRCAERREAWTRLERWLAPHLGALCGDALTTKLHWWVLAPGALRSLPLLGLRAGEHRFADRVESLAHLPSLGCGTFPPPPPEAVRAACLLARNRDEGDTSFGEAAIATLRRLAPPEVVVEPREPRGQAVVEAEILEAVADGLTSLRLYGVGMPQSLNNTTAALRLEGRRALGGINLAGLRLGRCESVELWGCVALGGDVPILMRDDGDRLPGLVADFLAAGAHGVLDVAWPVPDLVQAVVCEQLGFVRATTGAGPIALRRAVVAAAALLETWARHARDSATVPEALALLDAGRATAAEHHGVDPACLVPFADRGAAPGLAGLTVAGLLEEATHPSHLAAFRWWGAS
jgi:hypothetical protein